MTQLSTAGAPSNRLGGSFWDNTAGAAGVSAALVNPAANTNGCWVRSAYMTGTAANQGALYADTAAPSGVTDATKRSLLNLVVTGGFIQLAGPIFLPAGVGLWQASSAAGPRSAGTFDLV